MNILLILLKIIGILLLIVLILAALLLFHPIFYKIKGEAKEELSLEGYFWWLFQILRLEFKVEKKNVQFCVRIFGFRKKLVSDEEDEPYSKNQQMPEEIQTVKPDEDMPKQTDEEEDFRKVSSVTASKDLDSSKEKKHAGKKKRSKQKKKPNVTERLKQWKTEAFDERNRLALSHLWKELLFLLSHLKPKYVRAEIDFSMGDPALTGEVTGALSLLPLIYRYDAHVYPDFLAEKFYIKGDFALKGHMALFYLLVVLIRLQRDRNVKRIYHKFRK